MAGKLLRFWLLFDWSVLGLSISNAAALQAQTLAGPGIEGEVKVKVKEVEVEVGDVGEVKNGWGCVVRVDIYRCWRTT